MTREEQIIKAADEYYLGQNFNDIKIFHFVNGAKWADETMIDKACNWLLKGGYFVNNTETINDFKRAMEE